MSLTPEVIITEAEFEEAFAAERDKSLSEANLDINAFKDVFCKLLEAGNQKIKLRNFGSFNVVKVKATRKYIPSLGTVIDIPEHFDVQFEASKHVVETVKAE